LKLSFTFGFVTQKPYVTWGYH